ncbi:MAG: SRPBCC family protein [Gammaproteobacteria bacterium]|nr:SRPBCC family protein [Gammaproteobacteria bacterium]
MKPIKNSRTVAATAQAVFDVVANCRNYGRAIPGIDTVHFLTDNETGVGALFKETRRFSGVEALFAKVFGLSATCGGAILTAVNEVEAALSDLEASRRRPDPRAVELKRGGRIATGGSSRHRRIRREAFRVERSCGPCRSLGRCANENSCVAAQDISEFWAGL